MFEKLLRTTEGKLRVKIPTSLSEITLAQLIDLKEAGDYTHVQAISILSHIPLDDLRDLRSMNDLEEFKDRVASLAHQIKYLYNEKAIPKEVTLTLFDGSRVTVNVVKNLSFEPVGAYMEASDIIADEVNEHIKIYGEEEWKEHFNPDLKVSCKLLAQYFYCPATGGRYDTAKAEQFYDVVKHLPITQALPISTYFFLRYPNLLKRKISYYQLFLQRLKEKLGLQHSTNSSI